MAFRSKTLGLLVLALTTLGCQPGPAGLSLTGRGIALGLPLLADEAAVPVVTEGAVPNPDSAGTAPKPAPVGTPGNGGAGSASTGGGALRGQVLGVTGAREVPIGGATVRTSDGRAAVTAANGTFALAGDWPEDGALVASCPGHVASAVVGLTPGGALTLHLQSLNRVETQPPAATVRMRAVGRVVGPTGAALAGLTVVLEDAAGAASAPATTGPDGDFELQVFAPGGRVKNGTVLAVGESGHEWLGIATGVQLSDKAPELDLDATVPGNSPLVAQPANHPLRVNLGAAPFAAITNVALELVGPGATLALPLVNGVAKVAALPGTRFALRAEAIDGAVGTQSKLYMDDVAVDFQADESVVTAAMLTPPQVTSPVFLTPDELLTWLPVPGATAYQVDLAGLDDQGPLWEAFGTSPSMRFSHRAPLAPGNYGLTVTAWDAADLTVRAVLAAGARSLRTLPLSRSYRKSSRQVRRTR